MTALDTRANAKNKAGPTAISTLEECAVTAVIRAVTAHKVAAPAASPLIAWAVAPLRVVWPVSKSSQRADSSSPRRSRVLVNSPQTAPRIISVMDTLNTVKPATVWSRVAGPNSALVALLDPNAASRCCRWVCVL